jgi:hypothetical protein
MNRIAAILITLSLAFAACAHDHALGRRDVAAMQNDSPAISPWLGPVPNDGIEEDRLYSRGPGDEK